jgi:hypothetical protein
MNGIGDQGLSPNLFPSLIDVSGIRAIRIVVERSTFDDLSWSAYTDNTRLLVPVLNALSNGTSKFCSPSMPVSGAEIILMVRILITSSLTVKLLQ